MTKNILKSVVLLQEQKYSFIKAIPRHLSNLNLNAKQNWKRHAAIVVNPWINHSHPVNRSAALQYHSLLLAAEQQSLQHNLLKHILASSDLNTRVKGIVAYEEYEAILRKLKDSHYSVSQETLETMAKMMSLKITAVFEGHPRLQHQHIEMQNRLLISAWQTSQELAANEGPGDFFSQLTKRVQHCWKYIYPL